MVYLHKSVFQSHGYLSSANCYVDREWSTCTSRCSSHTVTCPVPTVTWDMEWSTCTSRCSSRTVTCPVPTVTWTGNGLPAQVGVPVARLPVQRQLLRGQSLGSQDLWVRTACVQDGKLQRTGQQSPFFSLWNSLKSRNVRLFPQLITLQI